jgi:hypothetical protein
MLLLNVVPRLTTAHDAASPPVLSSVCVECASAKTLVRGLGHVDRLVALPDGGLLILQDRQRILLLRRDSLSDATPTTTADGEVNQLIDLDVDPAFTQSDFVFALNLRIDSAGERTASVVRMRLVGESLAEHATIVPEFPINASATPTLSVGPDRLLYVAVPAADTTASARSPYDGTLLRYTIDGRAAGDSRTISPVLSEGVARPGPLGWDGQRRLWLPENADRSSRDTGFLLIAPLPDSGNARNAQQTLGSVVLGSTPVSGVAFNPSDATTTAFLIAGTPGALYRLDLNSSNTASLTDLYVFGSDAMNLTALARGSSGELFIAGSESASEGGFVARITDPHKLVARNRQSAH